MGIDYRNGCLWLLEPDRDCRELLTEVLCESGFVVEAFKTGEEALARAEVSRPCVVLTEVTLGGALGGHEFAKQLRMVDETIGLIALTGFEVSRVLELGGSFDAVVRKPFGVDELIQTVQRLADEPSQQPPSEHGLEPSVR